MVFTCLFGLDAGLVQQGLVALVSAV